MDVASDLERYMLELINAERAANGLAPVMLEQNLNTSADAHSQWMSDADTFSHTGVDGSSHTDRIIAADFDLEGRWRTTENIAAVSVTGAGSLYDEVDRLHENLMNSPSHRANILDPDVSVLGIGIVQGPMTYGNGTSYNSVIVTQNFAATTTGVLDLDLAGDGTDNAVTGGAGDDYLSGAAGSDTISTGAGDDTVDAGGGNDRIEVGTLSGDKVISGGSGNDRVDVSMRESDAHMRVDDGKLVVAGRTGEMVLDGVEWLDFDDGAVNVAQALAALDAPAGRTVVGDRGDDLLAGAAGNDLIWGQGGTDRLNGGAGDDVLIAEARGLLGTDISAQVYRLFDTVLGREPRADGHQGYIRAMATGTLNLDELSEQLTGSAEFEQRYGSLDDEAFVTQLFRNVLGRDPADSGLTAWTRAIENGMTRSEAALAISESPEHIRITQTGLDAFEAQIDTATWTDTVYRLFGAVMGREPAASGLEAWSHAIAKDGDLSHIVEQFMDTPEFEGIYGDSDDTEFMTLLFRNVLGREPAASGLAAWSGRLAAGDSRAEVVSDFINSAEYTLKTTPALETFMRTKAVDDVLTPGAGNSIMSGGFGSDSFVFSAGEEGAHEITDFENWDQLSLGNFGYGTADDALVHFTQDGDDVVFEDQGVRIVLNDWNIEALTPEMIDVA
ncbi:DUF4214 domain-containing protein [Sagittula sp. NFXS13]|uniref:DUF4214 domain-containing protein n=1 Tax=Sagittula sp. NFXS13 TaxID=2819095 RepID=UPI0032E01784